MDKMTEYLAVRKKLSMILKENAKDIIAEAFKKFFEGSPEVQLVHWTQYAPNFNDGEPCVFSVHDFSFGKEALSEDEIQELGGYPEFGDVEYDADQLINLDDELMMEVFGEDTAVVATRDGKFHTYEVYHD